VKIEKMKPIVLKLPLFCLSGVVHVTTEICFFVLLGLDQFSVYMALLLVNNFGKEMKGGGYELLENV
jgi:hypothetical protein